MKSLTVDQLQTLAAELDTTHAELGATITAIVARLVPVRRFCRAEALTPPSGPQPHDGPRPPRTNGDP